MILRERLESLGYQARPRPARTELDLATVAALLGAEVRENHCGPVLAIEEVVPMPALARYDEAAARLLSRPADAALPEGGLCFFDTETTGLSGGVGTQVFLAALAWRVPGGLLLRQYLLPDPALEQGFLEAIAADLHASDALVTYNGRTFDVPVLEGRLLMARRSADVLRMPHLDLLHPVRRIYKNRLGGCSLGSVEAGVLGGDRGDDIPGFLIPEMYFSFLRWRDPAGLRQVLAHNRQDVISLSLLLERLCEALQGRLLGHPLDRFGLARMLESLGFADRALDLYEGLWDETYVSGDAGGAWDGEVWPGSWSPVELGYVIGLRLAATHRREGRSGRAQPILAELWRRHPKPWAAGIMLAKELEHRRGDRAAALELVNAALESLEQQAERSVLEERWLEDLRKRQGRLARKLAAAA